MRALRLMSAAATLVIAAGPLRAQQTAANPHGRFTAPCAQCHRPDAWKPVVVSAQFKHAPNRFPLEGAHARVACATCHTNLEFTGVSANCATCHRDAHRGEVGTTCAKCHTTKSFLDQSTMRRAHQATAFPLTGRHTAIDCESCHTPRTPGKFALTNLATTCVSCHLPAYQAARNPPHAAAAFPKDCTSCHGTAGWQASAFDHSVTRFPLTGAHRAVTCTTCHAGGVYRGKPTTCVSCHQTNYNQTTNPNHTAAHFPTDCASCHTTAGWTGANFNHDASFFPINSGAHRGRWSSCATCHTNANNYAVFDCLSCHTRTQTDNQHRGRNGYVYASPNCYSCHPRGKS